MATSDQSHAQWRAINDAENLFYSLQVHPIGATHSEQQQWIEQTIGTTGEVLARRYGRSVSIDAQWHFSSTHTRKGALPVSAVAKANLASYRSVGIDVEASSRPIRDPQRLALKIAHPDDTKRQSLTLLQKWCAKEAAYKCLAWNNKSSPFLRDIIIGHDFFAYGKLKGRLRFLEVSEHFVAICFLPKF